MSMGFVKSAYIKENFGGNKIFKKLKDKKGFTLVELIVVLVILAILAALLIPALTGYIDKAKEKSLEAKTRNIVMATQTLIDEKYGTVKLDTTLVANVTIGGADATTGVTGGTFTIAAADIKNLAEVDVSADNVKDVTINIDPKAGALAKIMKLSYTENSKTCTYAVDGSGNTTFTTAAATK